MSSTKFDTLIAEFPYESAALSRLEELLTPQPRWREYSPARMYDLLRPSDYRVLTQILASAAEKGLLKRIVRVVSISAKKAGIAEFNSVLEIPPVIFDERIGQDIEVTPDLITLVYQVPPQEVEVLQ